MNVSKKMFYAKMDLTLSAPWWEKKCFEKIL